MKTISFVIPTIHKSNKLIKLIKKLRHFSSGSQIILINNAKENYSNIKFKSEFNVEYFHLKESGVSKSRNFGASRARSDFIYFLDDDILPNDKWGNALNEILTSPKYESSLVGGNVFIPKKIKKLVPRKYSFLLGEKILSNHDQILSRNYLAGCNIIFDTQIFNKLGGFPEEYGHKNGEIILNEDVYLQEKARKNGINIYFKNKLSVTHYWDGDAHGLTKRVQIQGLYDRKLDNQLNKRRLTLRMLKYLILIPIKFIFVCIFNQRNKRYHFDLLKYISYVRNNI